MGLFLQLVDNVVHRRGKCFACRGRFESHDVPKYVLMSDGVRRKVCRSCNNRMDNIADVPKNIVNKPKPAKKQLVDQSKWW